MSVNSLGNSIKSAVDKRVNDEARAKRGTIRNGRFVSGSKSYPFTPAVDCNTGEGKKVWAQLSTSGKAVVIGA